MAKKQKVEHTPAEMGIQPAKTLGSQNNPIKGPPPHTFAGPEVNYSPPQHALDSGAASPLGTQANPIRGPEIGSSPGVQNPGGPVVEGPAQTTNLPNVSEKDEQAARQAADLKLKTGAGSTDQANHKVVGSDGKSTTLDTNGESGEEAARKHLEAEKQKNDEAAAAKSAPHDEDAKKAAQSNQTPGATSHTKSAAHKADTGKAGGTGTTPPTKTADKPAGK